MPNTANSVDEVKDDSCRQSQRTGRRIHLSDRMPDGDVIRVLQKYGIEAYTEADLA
jgi:hypothetical protein